MPRIYKLFHYHQVRRADERRLSAWIGISLGLHVVLMSWAGFVARPAPPSAPSSVLTATLVQSVAISGPPQVLTPASVDPEPVAQIAKALPAKNPSMEQDQGQVLERHAPKTKESSVADGRTGLPNGSVNIGVVGASGPLPSSVRAAIGAAYPNRVTREPRLRGGLVVAYPHKALEARVNKRVLAWVGVDASGRPGEIRLAPDDPWFTPAIDEALKGVRFYPAEHGGERVPYYIVLEFIFTVTGGRDLDALSGHN